MHWNMSILQHNHYLLDRQIYLFMKRRMNLPDGNESCVLELLEVLIKLMMRIVIMIDGNGCWKVICPHNGVEEME